MLEGWINRKSKDIIGSTVDNLYNYQMLIIRLHKSSGIDDDNGTNNTIQNIYLGNRTKDDFSDIRFTDSNDILLSYFIKRIVYGVYADFVIKIPLILQSPEITKIYIYYNNPYATNISNGLSTFIKYDDFESYNIGSIDGQGDWSTRLIGGSLGFAEIRMLNDKKHLSFNSSSVDNTNNVQTTIMSPNTLSNNTRMYVKHLFRIQNNHFILGFCNYTLGSRGRPSDAYQCYFASDLVPPTGYMVRRISNSSTIMQTITDSQQLDIYYDLELSWYNGNIKAFRNNNLIGYFSDSTFSNLTHINLSAYSVPSVSYIDYIYIRQYIEPEPTWGTTGIEEGCSIPNCEFIISIAN